MCDCIKDATRKKENQAELKAARVDAKAKAKEFGETMVILKNGCHYTVKKVSEATEKGVEYYSKNS